MVAHAVKLVTEALDTVRRVTWNELRALPDQAAAKKFKGARWALLKRKYSEFPSAGWSAGVIGGRVGAA